MKKMIGLAAIAFLSLIVHGKVSAEVGVGNGDASCKKPKHKDHCHHGDGATGARGPRGPTGATGATGGSAPGVIASIYVSSVNGPTGSLNQAMSPGTLITHELSFQPDPSFFIYTPTQTTVTQSGIYEITALAVGFLNQGDDPTPIWGIALLINGNMVTQYLGGQAQDPANANRLGARSSMSLNAGDIVSVGIITSSPSDNDQVTLITQPLAGFPGPATTTVSTTLDILLLKLTDP